jgi:hypothetical protein
VSFDKKGKKMLSNELKKGAKIVLKGTGWKGTIYDNAKGNIRMAEVEGIYTEIGSIYVWDIAYAIIDGVQVKIDLTDKQLKAMKTIKATGF